jgi:hypothetical protein
MALIRIGQAVNKMLYRAMYHESNALDPLKALRKEK